MHSKNFTMIITLVTVCLFNSTQGVLIHKDNIIVHYEENTILNGKLRSEGLAHGHLLGIGSSCYIGIKNNRQKAYTIAASLIKNGSYNQEEVRKASYNDLIATTVLFGILTASGIWIYRSFALDGSDAFLCKALTGLFGTATGLGLILLALDHQPMPDLDQKILQLPITLAPGEEIKKMFWPKKDRLDDPVALDLDALQEVEASQS